MKLILAKPCSLISSIALSHSLFALSTSLNRLALKEMLLVFSNFVVVTGITTLFVFTTEYPMTNLVDVSSVITVNVSVSTNAVLP